MAWEIVFSIGYNFITSFTYRILTHLNRLSVGGKGYQLWFWYNPTMYFIHIKDLFSECNLLNNPSFPSWFVTNLSILFHWVLSLLLFRFFIGIKLVYKITYISGIQPYNSIFVYSSATPYLQFQLSMVSVPRSQSWSKNIKWKIPQINNLWVLNYMPFWVV